MGGHFTGFRDPLAQRLAVAVVFGPEPLGAKSAAIDVDLAKATMEKLEDNLFALVRAEEIEDNLRALVDDVRDAFDRNPRMKRVSKIVLEQRIEAAIAAINLPEKRPGPADAGPEVPSSEPPALPADGGNPASKPDRGTSPTGTGGPQHG